MRNGEESLVKSKQRVADHGEVFTPAWMVQDMLNLVADEAKRIDSRFLEPACGAGNFLVPVLTAKLTTVEERHGSSDFEKRHFALLALMSLYGIELLADNTQDCRDNLYEAFCQYLKIEDSDVWAQAARAVLSVNILQGDALKMTDANGESLVFPEWGYLGKGLFQRRDFRFETLTQRAAYEEDSLFSELTDEDLFIPLMTYPRTDVKGIAATVVTR